MSGVLAFDLGASSGRGIFTTINDNRIEMQEIRRFENYSFIENGRLKWNFQYIMDEILDIISLTSEKYHFDSIAVDTWGVDFGLIDESGQLIENPYHYRDERTNGISKDIAEIIDDKRLYSRTGIQLMEINSLYQLYATKKFEKDQYDKIDKILLMPDLINYFLTGEMKSERTIASTTQLYNPLIKDWDYELIEKLGFCKNFFTEIIDPGDTVGYLKDDICEKLGIEKKKVIAVGSHDTASAIVCTSDDPNNNLFLSSGTWSLMGMKLKQPIINEESFELNLSNETGIENKILLLKNITGLWLIQEARNSYKKQGREFSFSEIASLANQSREIECYFDTELPELNSPGDIPQKIVEIAKRTNQEVPSNEQEVFRVIYENLALKYREVFDELLSLTKDKINSVSIVGGGSNADLLSQFTSNALDLEVISGYSEATALGNSLVQLLSNKHIESLDHGKQMLHNSMNVKHFYPQETEEWITKYKKYKKYKQAKGNIHGK